LLDTKYISGKQIDIESLPYFTSFVINYFKNKGKNLHINYGQSQFTGTGIMVSGKKNTDKKKGEWR